MTQKASTLARKLTAYSILLTTSFSAWAQESILVGQYPAKVLPKQFQIVNLPDKSTISELAPEGQHQQGELIAKINYEDVLDAQEELELTLVREKLTALDTINDLEEQKRKLKFYLSLSEREQQYEQTLYAETTPPSPESLKDIDERIELTRKELKFSEAKQRKKIKKQEEKARLLMPFTGIIQYHFTLPENPTKPFECAPVAQFATLCDDSTYYIALGVEEAALTQLPANNFRARIALPAGKEIFGDYEFRRVEGQQGKDMLIYYFALPEAAKETAHSMIGTTAKAELYYQAPEQALHLSKAKLALDPHASESNNWEELIHHSYPQHNILLEAEKDIIIIPQGVDP